MGEPSSGENWSAVNFRGTSHYYCYVVSSLELRIHTYKVKEFNSMWWHLSHSLFNIFDTKISRFIIKVFMIFCCYADKVICETQIWYFQSHSLTQQFSCADSPLFPYSSGTVYPYSTCSLPVCFLLSRKIAMIYPDGWEQMRKLPSLE